MHSYEIHNSCYMLIILFGSVFHLANNGYDRLKVENLIVLGVYHMTAFASLNAL